MMETAVKERLVGAAVLVLLVVMVVPALLSGPPGPAVPDAADDNATRSVEIDIARPGASGTGSQAPPTSSGEMPSAPPGLTETGPGAKAQGAQDESPVKPAPAAGATTAATPSRPAASAPGWAVQVAALSNAESARRLMADLNGRGFTAFILEHRSGGQALYRVRVGPETDRERAAALAARLKDEGFKAAVVANP